MNSIPTPSLGAAGSVAKSAVKPTTKATIAPAGPSPSRSTGGSDLISGKAIAAIAATTATHACRESASHWDRTHADGSHAAEHDAVGDADDGDKHAGHDRGGDQRRPDLHGLAVVGAGEESTRRGRRRRRSAARRRWRRRGSRRRRSYRDEQERDRRGQRSSRHLQPRRVEGAHQVEMHRLGRAQPLHHADGHREEGEVGRDQRLRQEPAEVGRPDWPVSSCR